MSSYFNKSSIEMNIYLYIGLALNLMTSVISCPNGCHCATSISVICNGGISSVPNGIDSGIMALSLSGNYQQSNNLNRISARDLPNIYRLKHLFLAFSNVHVIEDFAFSKYTTLKQLKVNNNKIATVSNKTLAGLQVLEVLDLSGNTNLQIQPGTFSELPLLKELFLGETGFNVLDEKDFCGLKNLKRLDIHGNGIHVLNSGFLNLFNSLEYLDMSMNSIAGLETDSWKQLVSVKTVHLEGNPWNCDCSFAKLKDISNSGLLQSSIFCSAPSKLKYYSLDLLKRTDFNCSPPTISQCRNTSHSLKTFDTLTVNCLVTGQPFPVVSWIKPDGAVITPGDHSRVKVMNNGTLTLTKTALSDKGIWTLRAENVNGMSEWKMNLDVVPYTTLPPTSTTTKTTSATITITSSASISASPVSVVLPTKFRKPKFILNKPTPTKIATSSKKHSKSTQRRLQPEFAEQDRSGSMVGIVAGGVAGSLSLIAVMILIIIAVKIKHKNNKVSDVHPPLRAVTFETIIPEQFTYV